MADVELVIKIPEKVYTALTHIEFDANLVTDEMRKSIANGTPLPSIEPGKWIKGKKTPGYIKWNCSECGLLVRNPQKPWYEYCPKCGADMREVQDDD